MRDVLSVILGGGRGERLYPLTKYRAKPAVPLAGKYRLVDVPISNCLNSGLQKIAILTQFNSESLNKHIFRGYKLDSFSGGFVDIIAASQSTERTGWFKGTADAVRKCFKHFNYPRIKYILVLSGDQLYKMNFYDLLNFHIENKSEITVACNPVEKKFTPELGIMRIDKEKRIKDFMEKPKADKDIGSFAVKISGRSKFIVSMGIYVFNKDVLSDLLSDSKRMDFGKEIIPDVLPHRMTYAYMYGGYWRDIGSIKSFYKENLAFTDPNPPLDLFDENWQFFTRPRYLPLSKIQSNCIEDSNIAEGSIIEKAKIKHSIVGLRTRISSGSVIEDSVLMGCDYYENTDNNTNAGGVKLGIGKNCRIRKAIVDKNARIGDGAEIINKDNLKEFENDYCVIRDGIIIIPKNTIIPPQTVI